MSKRPTFTAAELERAAKVAMGLGCELVIEKDAITARMIMRQVDEPKQKKPKLGPKEW